MIDAPKKSLELVPSPPVLVAPPVPVPKQPIENYSYSVGFADGYKEGDSTVAGWAFGICGVVAIVCALVILWRHINRLTAVLERLHTGILVTLNSKGSALLLPLLLTACPTL